MTLRMYDENVARSSQAGALCRLQTAESRIAILGKTLEQYNQAARDGLLTGAGAGVFGRYPRATADIRKELARLEDEKHMANTTLIQCEAILLEAHRARKSADQYHRRVVQMIALKRNAELDNQAAAAGWPCVGEHYDSLENPNVY